MKKSLTVLLLSVVFMTSISCKNKPMNNIDIKEEVIIYFSHSGNTKAVAEHLFEYSENFTGIFEIATKEPYSNEMDEVLARGRDEFENNLRPELKEYNIDINSIDTIYLGFPVWFSSVPMAVLTFLESHDFSGITIIPFSTRGGGVIGESVDRIRNAAPNAKVLDGFHEINRANYSNANELLENWFNNFTEK